MSNSDYRGWEYSKQGDYHRNLDLNWSYAPTYLKKMEFVRTWINKLRVDDRILDAGCGEGVLVEEYIKEGRLIEGLDLNYSSEFVRLGDVLAMPFENERFSAVLLLDVFEHLGFSDQPRVLREIYRVLKPEGFLLATIPNLAHLNSRFRMFFKGKLDRTDIEENHPGERPTHENVDLINENGFQIKQIKGITLTIPWVYRRLICRRPAQFRWLHNWLDLFAYPSLAMLNVFVCKKVAKRPPYQV